MNFEGKKIEKWLKCLDWFKKRLKVNFLLKIAAIYFVKYKWLIKFRWHLFHLGDYSMKIRSWNRKLSGEFLNKIQTYFCNVRCPFSRVEGHDAVFFKGHRGDFFQVFFLAFHVELVSEELNHLAAILHVYARGLNFMK